MRKLTNKLFLSIFSLLLAIATLGSVTFAWMSLNSEAWVEGMDFQATGGDGFLISVDNKNYKSHLSKDDIVKSIVKNYSNGLYRFDDLGNLVDLNKQEITDYVDKMEKNIQLYPCTSYTSDSLLLSRLNGEVVDPADGEYIQFDIFFKPTSELKSNTDIYFNGRNDLILTTENVKYQIPQTSITTNKVDEIRLDGPLTTYLIDKTKENYGEAVQLKRNSILNVRSSNAIRLGFKGENEELSTILELTDENDLGSYATNISDYTNKDHELFDDTLMYDARYDATKNAMFTYYNYWDNKLTAIDYKKIPNTYTSLTNLEGKNQVKVCTLKVGDVAEKVTFKLWLEGWDADSIQGIAESILVQLSFAQKE